MARREKCPNVFLSGKRRSSQRLRPAVLWPVLHTEPHHFLHPNLEGLLLHSERIKA